MLQRGVIAAKRILEQDSCWKGFTVVIIEHLTNPSNN